MISVSKIKKIIVKIKKRNEKAERLSWLGSKPHSKGDIFSDNSFLPFRNAEMKKRIIVIKRHNIKIFVIIVSWDFLIGN